MGPTLETEYEDDDDDETLQSYWHEDETATFTQVSMDPDQMSYGNDTENKYKMTVGAPPDSEQYVDPFEQHIVATITKDELRKRNELIQKNEADLQSLHSLASLESEQMNHHHGQYHHHQQYYGTSISKRDMNRRYHQ